MALELLLGDAAQTERLGRTLAASLPQSAPFQNIFLDGELGAGKTTLVRALVESLPGGDEAEVGSPSFNLFNIYPTTPECVHVDLYRFEGRAPDDSLLELMESGRRLILVEWINRLPLEFWPDSYLLLRLIRQDQGRMAEIKAYGPEAEIYRLSLESELKKFL